MFLFLHGVNLNTTSSPSSAITRHWVIRYSWLVLQLNLINVCPYCPLIRNVEEPLFDTSELDYFGGKSGPLSREDLLQVLARILDGSRFQEFKSRFGPGLLCGFGFLHGRIVGIVANATSEGPIDVSEGQKGGTSRV